MADSGVTQPVSRGGVMRGCVLVLVVLALMAAAAAAGVWGVTRYVSDRLDPNPETIASASLQGLREQNRLSAFIARYVAVVTSKQNRMGLSAQKTLIMPGMVRYEVDLARLQQRDVTWDKTAKRLSIALPPIDVVGPQVDFNQVREYGDGGILMRITDAEAKLDQANRVAGQRELVRQAREDTPMKLAKEATRRAVERSFVMPLKAAGIDASVEVTFPDERPMRNGEQWDTSRSVEEVMKDQK